MKDFISTTYTFSPGASGVGTVTLSGISSFDSKKLVAIINQTRGVVIYSTGAINTRYTAINDSTLTLNVDTSTHSSNDILQVIYNDTLTPINTNSDNTDSLLAYIKQLVYILGNSVGNTDALNRTKIRAELVDAVTTVTTVTTVTNITNFGGMPQAEFGQQIINNTFANAIKSNITF